MSSAPTQLAVAPGASTLVTTTTQVKKDYLEESSYSCQNSLPPRIRSVKGKHLTRSHAMHESASPPRTPTPRSSGEGLASSPTSFSGSASAPITHSHTSSNETVNDHKVQVQSLSPSPLLTSSPISINSTTQTQESTTPPPLGPAVTTTTIMYSGSESNGVVCNQSQLDVDFPKLTPPKSSKGHRNHNNNNVNRDSSEKQLNNSSDSSISSGSTKQQIQQPNNYGSGGMMGNTDGKNSIKNTEIDGPPKMNHHNNNNKNHRGNSNQPNNSSNSLNNSQPPLVQKQTQSQRRSQSSYSHQQQHQHMQQEQQQPNHQIQNDSNLINSINNMQISSPPPSSQSHHLCLDKETSTSNRYTRTIDDNCVGPIAGNQMNCNNSSCSSTYGHDENRNNVISESPTDNTTNMSNTKCDRQMGKKHRNNANAKGSKARLKNMGSSSSVEGGNSTSGFISRDSSTEQFTDSSGIDLKEFFRETLSKNPVDRSALLGIEKDLTELVHDKNRSDIQYPAMSSYNRMLIHRVAAFFGMEHNVDSATPHCVIVSKTKQTRIPSIKFKSLYRASDAPPRKSILKRDAYSFDEPRRNLLNCPDRGMLDRKSKSYEQREEEYEQVRKRIFRVPDGGGDMSEWPPHQWCNESPEHSNRLRHNKLLKVQSMSNESRPDGRPSVSKSHSFGGYGGPPQGGGPLTRGDSINSTRSAGPRLFPKQDSIGSTNTPWRLSPSSSGSIYRFDPSNLPPSQAAASGTYSNNKTSGTVSGHRKIIVDKPKVVQSDLHNGSGNNDTTLNTNTATTNSNNTQDTVEHNSNIVAVTSGQSPTIVDTTNSVENLSESSAQSVLVVDNSDADQDDEHDANITKDNHPHREMSDIQEEAGIQSNEDRSFLTMDTLTDTQEKPKLINQATSPNIPTPEPEPAVQSNESSKSNSNSTVEENPSQTSVTTTSSALTSTTSAHPTTSKKDDSSISKQSSATPNIPLMSFAPNGYQAFDGSTVFASPTNGSFPTATAYQTGPDGSVYAVPQQMVYAYPPPMDGEFQGYFMPVYDQSQRDPNALVAAASTPTIYQPAGGPTTAVVAYPTAAPYGGAPLYQSQVVYSPADQFATAAAGGQLQQYPVPTYPVGYTYPYNGYWGQPTMTYYVPQAAPAPIASSIMTQPMTGGANACLTSIGSSTGHSSHSNSSNSTATTKRSTPPHNSSSGHNSQSVTPAAARTYQFAATAPPGLPLAALTATAADPNTPPGTTMYAIPQTATVFPSMLPYAPAPGTPSGMISHHLATAGHHSQPNAVINPLISTHNATGMGGGPQIPLDVSGTPSGAVGYSLNNSVTDRNGSHGAHNSSATPHSAPSTPLLNSVAIPHHQRNPPPLFATPPMLPAGYHNMHGQYTHLSDMSNGCGMSSYSSGPSSHYERKNSNKRNSGYVQNNRQNSYSNNQTGRKNMNDPSSNSGASPSTNQNGNNRSVVHMQQKRTNINSDKNQSGVNNNNTNSAQNNTYNADKPRNSTITNNGGNGGGSTNSSNTSVIRNKPSNLDLRRSASQRNSPSTNSIESSNNSPNSIASMNHIASNNSFDHGPPMYMTRGTHVPPMHHHHHQHMHPPTAAAVVAAAAAAAVANDACHQQLIGAAYNPPGMYIKYQQPYFAPHPSMALPSNRRSPPNDMRPQLAPLTGVYPTVNMMLPAPRTMPPRQPNPNYKGNKPSR